MSLSARRAWIEIIDDLEPSRTRKVALRKESVDRNFLGMNTISYIIVSLSARRAWIEIKKVLTSMYTYGVALRKESVDRNRCTGTGAGDHTGVALRKESVDRNFAGLSCIDSVPVALRKESVDRNSCWLLA